MGREVRIGNAGQPVRLTLQRVKLDRGGYDSGGAYWGLGKPLWRARDHASGGSVVDVHVRAIGRGPAIDAVRRIVAGATFFRGA